MAILSMIPQSDPDPTAYLNELPRTNKPEQQNNTFWFPTLENPRKPEDHTPIQTQTLKELIELRDKEKISSQGNTKSRNKILKRSDWTDRLLSETERQTIEDILVDYKDIFARNRMDIGMNTEFKVKPTPKDNKAVDNQSLPMPIHLKEDLIVELSLMHKYGIIKVLPFSKYSSPIFAQRKPNGKLRLLVDLQKINSLIADDYTNNNLPISTLSDAAQHLAGKSLVCKLEWNCSHSILPAKPLHTKDLQKIIADFCLLFQVSCVSTWTQSPKLTNVLKTWMTLESQPILLRTSPGAFEQSSSAFAQLD